MPAKRRKILKPLKPRTVLGNVVVDRPLPVPRDALHKILEYIAQGNTIVYSIRKAGANVRTFYTERQQNPEYDEAVKEAYRQGIEALEQEATRRGMEGVAQPVLHQGQQCYYTKPVRIPLEDKQGNPILDEHGDPVYTWRNELVLDDNGNAIPIMERKYSDNLLMFVAKARDPQRYGDKREITNVNDPPVLDGDLMDQIAARLTGVGEKVTIQETITRTVTVEGAKPPANPTKTLEARLTNPAAPAKKNGNGSGNGHG